MKNVFQCKSCGGSLVFNPDGQNLICEHCKNKESIKLNPQPANQIQYSTKLKFDQSLDCSSVFKCQDCETKIASSLKKELTRCPSCGSKNLHKIHETQIHPMNIIPFKISKSKASSCYKKWINSRLFAPNNLKKMARQQKISGYYAPIYLFDFDATTHYSAHGISERKRSDGSVDKSTRYINDVLISQYDDYIYSANRKISSELFRKMDGFDASAIIPYSNEFMLGFMGLGTNRTIHSSLDLVEEEIANIEQSHIKSKLNLKSDDVDFFRANTTLSKVWCDYLYVPIWSNHYSYKGKDYHCYINGQTGKVTGKSPKSFWKILGLTTLILAGVGLLSLLFI